MHNTPQRYFNAVLERRRSRQPVKPGRDPGAVLLGKLAGLAEAAAWRHGKDCLARDGDNSQRIAAGLTVTPQAHQMNGAVALDFNGLRFGRTAVKQCARRHR
jgi:hypothetical protein